MNKEQAEFYMRQALLEGRKASEKCGDNPPVGCVLVCDGKIVARGHTNEPGRPHAEAMALGQLARNLKDVVGFVTLEPCSFDGRTPSCAQALVNYGISVLFVGTLDPDPRNSGAGLNILKNAGVKVETGLLEKEILIDIGTRLNARPH